MKRSVIRNSSNNTNNTSVMCGVETLVPIFITQVLLDNMKTQEWLNQCKNWTPADDKLYDEGMKSGTAINPETNRPYTMEDIKQIVHSLPY